MTNKAVISYQEKDPKNRKKWSIFKLMCKNRTKKDMYRFIWINKILFVTQINKYVC